MENAEQLQWQVEVEDVGGPARYRSTSAVEDPTAESLPGTRLTFIRSGNWLAMENTGDEPDLFWLHVGPLELRVSVDDYTGEAKAIAVRLTGDLNKETDCDITFTSTRTTDPVRWSEPILK